MVRMLGSWQELPSQLPDHVCRKTGGHEDEGQRLELLCCGSWGVPTPCVTHSIALGLCL